MKYIVLGGGELRRLVEQLAVPPSKAQAGKVLDEPPLDEVVEGLGEQRPRLVGHHVAVQFFTKDDKSMRHCTCSSTKNVDGNRGKLLFPSFGKPVERKCTTDADL